MSARASRGKHGGVLGAGARLILHRGDVYRVRLEPAEGHEQQGEACLCLVVHREALRSAGTAIVVRLITREPRAGFPLTVPLPRGTDRNERTSWPKITPVRVVAETRFLEPRIARLSEAELEQIKDALRIVLDL